MNILFLESHPMWIYGLPNGFRDIGHKVTVSGSLTEEKIDFLLSNFKPDLVITMGWGPENASLEKQNMIHEFVKSSGVPHIYWATEDPTHTETFSLPFLRKVQTDFVFTICSSRIQYYDKLGIKAAHLDFGHHSKINYPNEYYGKGRNSISVVANAYPKKLKIYPNHYRHESLKILISPLIKNNQKINFYGRYWEEMKPFIQEDIPSKWIQGYLHYTEVNKVYCSSDIIIGLQNHRTQLTQRTYEILASGGFLLTNDTPEIRRHFTPGKDLIVSSSPEETIELVNYYLKNPDIRKTIKEQAILAVENHSYKHRAEYIIETLLKEKIFDRKLNTYIENKDKYGVEERPSNQELRGALLQKPHAIFITKGKTYMKQIALTYDSGVNKEPADEAILDTLQKYGVESTFFLTGQFTESYPYVAKRLVKDGHEIGNHSYSHPDFAEISREEIINEIKKCEEIIKKNTGENCRPLFRPPYGSLNANTLKYIGEAGYRYSICWSLDTIDWKNTSSATIVNRILDKVQNGDIILLHLNGIYTAAASEIVIPILKSRGFNLVTVSELLRLKERKI